MLIVQILRRTARLYIFLLQVTFRFDSLEPSSPRDVVDRRGLESVPPGADSGICTPSRGVYPAKVARGNPLVNIFLYQSPSHIL